MGITTSGATVDHGGSTLATGVNGRIANRPINEIPPSTTVRTIAHVRDTLN
jgi:hypothetical protein